MTDTQYKHLGKAVETAMKLATKLETLYPLRSLLCVNLTPLIGSERAVEVVRKLYAQSFPVYEFGSIFNEILATIEKKK